jgi:hypothetical protein
MNQVVSWLLDPKTKRTLIEARNSYKGYNIAHDITASITVLERSAERHYGSAPDSQAMS